MNDEIKPEMKQSKKGIKGKDMIGLIFGVSLLAWAIGLGGIIPYFFGILFVAWLARKMLSSEKTYLKTIFWILFILIYIGGAVNHRIQSESRHSPQNTVEDVSLLETDKSPENSQVNGNMYRNTKYNFRIKFPAGWEIKQGDGLHIVQKATSGNSTISIIIQEFDLGSEKFSSIKDELSAKEFIDTAMEGLKEKFSDVRVIDYGETKIDNEPAYWVEYSSKFQVFDFNLEMTRLIYFIAKGNVMYSIHAGTASDQYAQIKPKFYQVVSTFALEN